MRLVVVTNGNFFARVILTGLFQEEAVEVAGVVIITGIKANQSRIHSLVEIWRQSGLRYFAYKASTYLVFAVAKLMYPQAIFFVPSLARRNSVPVKYTGQVNEASAVSQIREWKPDILVSVSCPQRIRENLLSVPTAHAINIHSSLLPQYAGIAPYFWVLAKGESVTGITVHIMEREFDTGPIITQKKLNIGQRESAHSLFFRLCELGSDALAEAVADLAQNNASFMPQEKTNRSYYSWPTPEGVHSLLQNGHRLVTVSDGLVQHPVAGACSPRFPPDYRT